MEMLHYLFLETNLKPKLTHFGFLRALIWKKTRLRVCLLKCETWSHSSFIYTISRNSASDRHFFLCDYRSCCGYTLQSSCTRSQLPPFHSPLPSCLQGLVQPLGLLMSWCPCSPLPLHLWAWLVIQVLSPKAVHDVLAVHCRGHSSGSGAQQRPGAMVRKSSCTGFSLWACLCLG